MLCPRKPGSAASRQTIAPTNGSLFTAVQLIDQNHLPRSRKMRLLFSTENVPEVIMRLNEYEHELQRDLQSVASDLRWSAVDLKRIAEQLRKSGNEADAQSVLRSCEVLQSDEERLQLYAREVKARAISRTKIH
jgi:methylthioribose-1-phosphate isomerase